MNLRLATLAGAILGILHGVAATAAPVVPNFTTGTVTSHTTSTQTITESIRQIDYHVGSSYTVTGTNITVPGTPAPGAGYTITTPGEPFQFTETHFGAGISRITEIDRSITTLSTSDSISVFSQ